MEQKHYLFYQKQSLSTFWKNSLYAEKFFLISWILFSLFWAGSSVYLTFCSTNPTIAAPLFASIWLFCFPGMTFFCHHISKSYWIVFEEHSILRHGNYQIPTYQKRIPYEQAAYILIGDLPPFLIPGRTSSSDWYHKKFGNYINVLDQQKKCLFTVRYSEPVLDLLCEKCKNAQVITVK